MGMWSFNIFALNKKNRVMRKLVIDPEVIKLLHAQLR